MIIFWCLKSCENICTFLSEKRVMGLKGKLERDEISCGSFGGRRRRGAGWLDLLEHQFETLDGAGEQGGHPPL